MNARHGILLAALVAAVAPCSTAHAGVRIGIGIGIPCWGGPYYYPGYVAAAPVVYYPPPVYAVPATTVAAPPACASSAAPPAGETAPPPRPLPTAAMNTSTETTLRTVSAQSSDTDAQRLLQALSNPDEQARADAATGLGRLKSPAAVDPLAATLAGDHSPTVRAAAARALAVIGDPRALLALQRAVQGDPDNDVRRTAQFAMEVIASR